jgi:CRISPR-associated protein Cas1
MRSAPYPRGDARSLNDPTADILYGLEAGFSADPAGPAVAVVLGHGAKVSVRRGHLYIEDGEGWYRRERTWNRATGNLRRLVIGAESGFVSLDVLAWCRDAKVSVIVIDDDADVMLVPGAYGTDDARLRRLQAAPPPELAVDLAAAMLQAKLDGHAKVARSLLERPDLAYTIDGLGEAMDAAPTIDELRQLEASAAACYFDAWIANPATTVRFRTADTSRVPAHWFVYEGRRSLLTNGNNARKAERPLNALLNLTYRFAELECRLALVAMGLDPGLGFVHADMPNRDSLALDLLEALRPDVERHVLNLVAERTFSRTDFVERNDGSVRIAPPLVQHLAGTMPMWAQLAAGHAEELAHALGRAAQGTYRPRTPLSGTNQRAAQAAVKARKQIGGALNARNRAARTRVHATEPGTRTCIDCGAPVVRARDLRCTECWERTPGQSAEVRRRRGRAIAAARAKLELWQREHPDFETPRDHYLAEIRPNLASVKLRDIMAATGLSKSTTSMIRSGKHIPAARHWPKLAALTGVDTPRRDDRSID